MADQKLSALPAGSAVVDGDLFYSAPVAGGQVKQLASALKSYVLSGGGAGNVSAGATLANNAIVVGRGTTAVATLAGVGTNNQILIGQTGADPAWTTTLPGAATPAYTGDVTSSAGGTVNTLASIITAGGPTGSASIVPVITYDAKGRLIAVTTATITITAGSVTGLAAIATSGSATDLTAGTVPAARVPAYTGDVTSPSGSTVNTLASTITAGGPTGSSTVIPVITYDAKGRLTAVTTATIAAGGTPRTQRFVNSAITVSGTDQIINCNIASPTSVTLPLANTRAGQPLTFKDVGGQCFTNNLTINRSGSDLIDGQTSYVLANNYAGVTFMPANDGTTAGWYTT
jgi:hypothetical protein